MMIITRTVIISSSSSGDKQRLMLTRKNSGFFFLNLYFVGPVQFLLLSQDNEIYDNLCVGYSSVANSTCSGIRQNDYICQDFECASVPKMKSI